jgi:hypothetical protein
VKADLRALRDEVNELGKSHRRHLVDAQNRQSVCERLFGAWVEESDPVLRTQIHNALASCGQEYDEAASLEEKSRAKCEMLRAELADCEVHFAQSEILATANAPFEPAGATRQTGPHHHSQCDILASINMFMDLENKRPRNSIIEMIQRHISPLFICHLEAVYLSAAMC